MKKILSIIMCLIIVSAAVSGGYIIAVADDTVNINSAKDLVELEKKCSLDSWSVGKNFVLTKDIDMSKTKFKGIPSFSGSFDGNGHTISGISMKHSGSYVGLFRYVKNGGEVKNLNVTAKITPGGSASKIGVVAGSNSGSIINCNVNAEMKGKSYVGGVAGLNTFEGVISNSSSKGKIYGEHYAGGIAGQNLGTILSCNNKAKVNTYTSEIKLDIENINFDKLISAENVTDITDVGGIAGFSSGIIQSCENRGTVGYNHVGYNIGGIAGRQSGYLNGCSNYGKVYGRKDVGGIAGQLEPYTVLRYSEDSMESLSSELKTLQKLLNNVLDNANYTQNTVSAKFREINGYADDAIDSINVLSKKTEDMLNANIDNVNNTSARLTESLSDISAALGGIDELSENLDLFTSTLKDISAIIKESADEADTSDLTTALDELSKATKKFKIASTQLSNALRDMRNSISDLNKISGASQKVAKAFEELQGALGGAGDAVKKAGDALKGIADQLKSGNADNLDIYFAQLSSALVDFGTSLKNAADDIKNVASAVRELGDSIANANLSGLVSGASKMASAFFNIGNAMGNLDNALKALKDAVSKIDTNKIKDIAKKADKSVDYLQNAADALESMARKIADSMKKLSDSPIITINPIDDEYIEAADNVTKSMTNISGSFDSLNGLLSTRLNSISNDLQAVSDQMFVVTDILIDAVEDAYNLNLKDELSDRFSDISEDDTQSQTTGKISGCTNEGTIEGDLNVGGIAGQMAIEYDFDPEDDIANGQKRTSNFMFTTRAIVRECTNYGDITAKKNHVGGIAGRINLGCVLLSNGCGKITSKTGGYAGGIAGYSESVLKNNNAKCTLSAADYVGGIAGKAEHIYDCRSVVYIEDANEKAGAIAGEITGESGRNIFCDDVHGGVDSISYAGIAEPVGIDDIIASPNGEIFKTFTAVFKINEKTVGTVNYDYNGSIEKSQIPKLPVKKDSYAVWDMKNFKNLKRDIVVNAEYKPFITSVESSEKQKNGLAKVVAEGKYSEDTKLKLTKPKVKAVDGFYKTMDAYTVKLTDVFDKNSKLHYLPPSGKADKTVVFSYGKNGLKKLKTSQDGSCVVFKMEGDSMTFIAVQNTFLHLALKSLAVILLAVAFVQLALLYINIIKRKVLKS